MKQIHSRRYYEIKNNINSQKVYPVKEALELLLNNHNEKSKVLKATFNIRKTKQKFTFNTEKIVPPFPLPNEKNILVITDGFDENFLKNIKNDFSDKKMLFLNLTELDDQLKNSQSIGLVLANQKLEKELKKWEKALNKKGIYPNKKNGSLSEDITPAIKRFYYGEKLLKVDKTGNINFLLGNNDYSLSELEANYKIFYNKIITLRPVNWKGKFVNKIILSTAMGPGIKVNI